MKNFILFICFIVMIISCASVGNDCSPGYTGDNCNIKFNEKYDGFYVCSQTGPVSGTIGYNVVLNAYDTTLFQFRIGNLAESGFSESITPVIHSDDPNKFSMVKQVLGATGYEVEVFNGVSNGYGNYITADYSIYNELGLIETRSIVLTK